MKLYLIRHGKTKQNIDEMFCGSTDAVVCDVGFTELEELKKTISYPKADRYFTSGMTRTKQTLETLYQVEQHEAIEDFKEMNFGDFENQTFKSLATNSLFVDWSKDTFNQQCPGGESGKQVLERIKTGVEKIRAMQDDSVVLVTHGAVIAMTMMYLFEDIGKTFEQLIPNNGRGYSVDLEKMEFEEI